MNFSMLLLIGLKMGRYLFIHYPTYPTFPGIADSNKKEQMKFCVYISRFLFSDFRFISLCLSPNGRNLFETLISYSAADL